MNNKRIITVIAVIRKIFSSIPQRHGVSAVISVALMVAIVVAIASVTYLYVSNSVEISDNIVIEGKLNDIQHKDDFIFVLQINGLIYDVNFKNMPELIEYLVIDYSYKIIIDNENNIISLKHII